MMNSYTGHIRMEMLFLRKAEFEQVIIPGLGPLSLRVGEPIDLKVSVQWWERDDDRVDVGLEIGISPHPENDQPYNVTVAFIGRFLFGGELPQGLTRDEFVKKNSIAIMLPFAREAIGNLTLRGSFGPLWLPPINVAAMLKQSNQQETDPEPEPAQAED